MEKTLEIVQDYNSFCVDKGIDKRYEDSLDSYLLFLKNTIEESIEIFEFRRCSECNTPMDKGYVVNDGCEYYCSDNCLHKYFTESEWLQMYENDGGYYTEWETLFCE